VPRRSKSLWNSFLVRSGVLLLLIRYTRLYLVTVSFLLRYQNDQGRYIHFLHTRQNVFYATYPYPDKSQPKMKTCDPMIHQANNDISLQENQRRNKYLSTSNPQRQINKKTNGFNEDIPNKKFIILYLVFSNKLSIKWLFQKQKTIKSSDLF
jgi:hypothetical protein